MSLLMLHSPAKVLKGLLLAGGQAVEVAGANAVWPCYVGREPDGAGVPDNVVTVYNTEGIPDGRLFTGEAVIHEGLQVRVRAVDEPTGKNKIAALRFYLSETVKPYTPVTLTNPAASYMVHALTHFSAGIGIGSDKGTSRELFTLNLTISVRRTA